MVLCSSFLLFCMSLSICLSVSPPYSPLLSSPCHSSPISDGPLSLSPPHHPNPLP